MDVKPSTTERTAFGRPMPKYRPCKYNGGKHEFERLKHNVFDKCIHCGEPRFALLA